MATPEQNQLICMLEDTANLLQKTQTNLRKCPKTRLTKGYIEARMKIIDDYWQSFKTAHQDLVKITPKELKGSLPYFLNEEFYIYEDLYNVLQGDLQDMLTSLADKSARDSVSANNSLTISHNNMAHLPKIQIPKFSGSYESWQTFQDLFTSLVHDNSSLSDVQKLHYLKTSVTQEAESLLKHIQVTANNYSYAWEILKGRYGNKRLIINRTMKRLFDQKKMSTQSAVQLKGLLDTTTECLNNLENLNISVASWDPVLIYLLVQKMDSETHKNWEEYAYKENSDALPTWCDLKRFMESKFRTLELTNQTSTRDNKTIKERSFHVATSDSRRVCVMCKDNHSLSHCKEFSKLEPSERSQLVKDKQLCFNCLVPGHSAFKCKLPVSCRVCHRRHHSLLHDMKNKQSAEETRSQAVVTHVEEEGVQINTMMASHCNTRQRVALLATAVVRATSKHGHSTLLRALIDQGSEAAFISEKATQLLKLERQPVRGSVVGVGSSRTEIKHVVNLQISSNWDRNFCLPIKAYVMSKPLTTKIPIETIKTQPWPHIQGLNLADPSYFSPSSVDLLLGVKEYTEILQNNFIKGPPGTPSAQKTSLGWMLFGEICTRQREDNNEKKYVVMHQTVDVEDMLRSMWEIDSDNSRHLTREEQLCEELYDKTTTRDAEGRYIVKLPFRTYSPQSPLGNTKNIALQRFFQLEKKLKRSPDLKNEYSKVIIDYIDQGHMEKIPETERNNSSVYLPHHAVIRTDKETTRTRVVFDASCRGTNNISLNEELLVGPQLQEDLRSILMRWRMKRVCFLADIQQMYRQIKVTHDDADYQRILWRQNEADNIDEYRLLRVTFGTASAPYLAVKTLHQVAKDEAKDNTLVRQTIMEDTYVDDLLSGADTTAQAISLAREISNTLRRGKFHLTKWSSNSIEFLKSIEKCDRSGNVRIDMNLDGTTKALGIVWNLKLDTFQYKTCLPPMPKIITKRNILSDIQKLFDPLGWIAPSTVVAKILIQKLWLERVNWDDKVSSTLEEQWKHIRSDFANTTTIQIERWLCTTTININTIQIHGFSDASMQAYAAVVYVRVKADNNICTRLIAARTKVAPVKTISVPRLELCGALLLSKLMKQVAQAMRISTSQMYAWTDSQIVMAWLCGEPNRWKPFVANRVVEIVENVNNKRWHHVQSQENPADLASRGIPLAELKESELWWHGPSWLSETEVNVMKQETIDTELELKTTKIKTHLSTTQDVEQERSLISQFENFESLTELIKCISYCRRFLNYKKNKEKECSYLSVQELEDSLNICIKRVQQLEYDEEIKRLNIKKQVKKRSPLRSLNPYLDEENILRVGGRLRHANISNDMKHPIILGSKNALTTLIIADAHIKTLHGGVQLMLCYLRSKYWIIRAKSLVRKHIHKCMVCARWNASTKAQIMGDLPAERVTPSRPFLYSGVDFAGPFQTLMSKGRGNKTTKTYVAIFICMCTKAVHIELVGDLSSEAFIGAFRRFVARRGKCSHLWSDCGRNFVGADKQLQDAMNDANLELTGKVASTLATDGTQFHFIPPYSPHFGGLWEAGVKSIKYHMKRILTMHLTYEEMTTILCQIEACLNSRPLCPIDDDDPDNISLLTPGHFLIGETPIVVPSPSMQDVKVHNLSRWQHTQKLVNDFWKRWQCEYLARLQQRPKWLKKEREFQIGDIVLIKTDSQPPGKWPLGRIIDKHPGADGHTRVYSVKSGNTVTKRTVTKLCALPVDSN